MVASCNEYLSLPKKYIKTKTAEMLSASISKVAHLRLSLQLQEPQLLALELSLVLLAIASAWGAIVSSAPASTWFEVLSASGRQLSQDAQTGQLHIISPHLQLPQTPSEPVSKPSPVQVISWDPSRPWRGPAHQPAQLGSPLTFSRSAVGPESPATWGVGLGQLASSSVGCQTSGPTLTAHQVFCRVTLIGHQRFDPPPAPLKRRCQHCGKFADANIVAISS